MPMRHQQTAMHNKTTVVRVIDPWYLPLIFPLYVIIASGFFYWRLRAAMDWDFWLAWPLLIADAYTLLGTLLFLSTSREVIYPVKPPHLTGKSVDILIPTLNEPIEIIKQTLLAAVAVRGVNQVFLLDDGQRPAVKQMTETAGAIYLARPTHEDAKAGNLNYGLKYSQAEFVAFFDCDFIPQPDFIERTLGYFRDEQLAFVQTPQMFYNIKSSIQHRPNCLSHLWNEQTMFYQGIQPAKNKHNAVFFCGTNALFRRAALDDAGGLATQTATEDIHTALKLHARGWKSWYLNEVLAYGLAPEDIQEYHKQRVRWGAGSLGLLFRSPDSPLIARGLSWMQRLCYISSMRFFTTGFLRILYYITPILAILTRASPGKVPLYTYLLFFVPFLFFSMLAVYLHARRTYHPLLTEQFNVLNVFSNVVALKGVLKAQKKFSVSIKRKTKIQGLAIYNMIVAIMGLMLMSNWYAAFSWFYLKGGTVTGFLSSDISGFMFWNSFNLIFVWSFLHYLKKFYTRVKHRTNHEVRPTAELLLDQRRFSLQSLSLTEAVLLFKPGERVPAHMSLPLTTNHQLFYLKGIVEQARAKDNPGTLVKLNLVNLTSEEKQLIINFNSARIQS